MPEAKPPYFPTYAERTISETQMMPMDAIGAYFTLRAIAWLRTPPCTIPDDGAIILQAVRLKASRWKEIKQSVMVHWRPDGAGNLVCDSLLSEYENSVRRMEINRTNGIKGGRPKVQKITHGLTDGLTETEPIGKPIAKPSGDLRLENSIPTIAATACEAGPSLTGIRLTPPAQAAQTAIFEAASAAMRPKGPAGENWVMPLRMAEKVLGAIDSMLVSGPAIIGGIEREPWFYAAEISSIIENSNPAGVGPLCNFIPSIWDRCQRQGCVPGAKQIRKSLETVTDNSIVSSSEIDDILAKGK